MAWEERNERQYYYRKRREGKRVISEYLGSGSEAAQYAQSNEEEKMRISIERESRREVISINEEIDRVCETLSNTVRAWLLASGYHQHKRQWRKRRNVRV